MWIFCCGAKRSGSTLQYNIVSEIVESSKSGIRVEYVIPEEFSYIKAKYSNFDGYKVFKTHKLTADILKEFDDGNALGIFSYRDVRDVIVSLKEKGWVQDHLNTIQHTVDDYIRNFYQWNSLGKKVLSRKYETFIHNLEEEISVISEFLLVYIDPQVKSKIASEYSLDIVKQKVKHGSAGGVVEIGNKVFDSKTLLHLNHIVDGEVGKWRRLLTPETQRSIEEVAAQWLYENEYELSTDRYFVSYSQHADDYLLFQLSGKKRGGLVIEVGAFDGKYLSNSIGLENIGWKSICIEPNPKYFKLLVKNRPKSICLQYAVIDNPKVSIVQFNSEKTGVLSGISIEEEELKRRYKKDNITYVEPIQIKVPARTGEQLLEDNKILPGSIDVISVDVEGFELQVLTGFNILRYKPSIFIIEANDQDHKQKVISFFRGLKLYYFLGSNKQNLIFQLKSKINKGALKNLDYKNYLRAKISHPNGDMYNVKITQPSFTKSYEFYKAKDGLFLHSIKRIQSRVSDLLR